MGVVADKLMTAEEFAAKYDDAPFELVRGSVVPLAMPGSNYHGWVCAKLARYLDEFVEAHAPGGAVCSNDTYVVVGRNPDTVRGADVAYWPMAKLPGGKLTWGLIYNPPHLCAEVVSPTNTWSDILTKVDEYLAAGVPVAVVLDPDTQTATAYRKPNGHGDDGGQVFKVVEDLTLPDILPGFSVPVRKFFE
ncbi:MAG: Uma2 family endonuclease [Gemmataceae bacterium]|nr:Uma2 family endonuclease [Gemmataceae bacterium]